MLVPKAGHTSNSPECMASYRTVNTAARVRSPPGPVCLAETPGPFSCVRQFDGEVIGSARGGLTRVAGLLPASSGPPARFQQLPAVLQRAGGPAGGES